MPESFSSQTTKGTGTSTRKEGKMRIAAATTLLAALALTSAQSGAQSSDTPLTADISAVQAEIRKAEEDDQQFSGGLVKSLISLRLATLRQTLALLEQRSKATAARTTLQYTIDGRPLVLPSDAPSQIAALESDIAESSAKVTRQEAEVARYSGGLIHATTLATLATLRQTQAMLEQKRLALKYGLPQFVGFRDILSPASATPTAPASNSRRGPAAATSAAVTGNQLSQPSPPWLEVKLLNKHLTKQDYQDFIFFDVEWHATGLTKAARAIKGILQLQDLFGQTKMKVNWTIDKPLAPGEVFVEKGTGFRYNMFMSDHQWVNGTDLTNMKAVFAATNIIYQDGTTEEIKLP
jgi:hypothetical protein